MVDAAEPLPELDLSEAEEWRVLVTRGGDPCNYVILASPGKGAGRNLLEMALLRHAWNAPERPPPKPAPEIRVSLIVPTHRRPERLRDLLETAAALDPPPFEVIVVDNDPDERTADDVAAEFGFRYVREPRKGLNIARRRGLAEARGEVVAYTDDDCLLPTGWLRRVPEAFLDPLVGAVSGPGFPAELETGAQLRRDEEAGFQKPLELKRYDWRTVPPVNSGVVGSGNGMAFRRELALDLELFPPELDAGTRAPAAGDLYALYRVLAAGWDVVQEPAMFFFHRHPAEAGSARRTIRAYGLGVGAYCTKVLFEDGELAVLATWHWFLRRWVEGIVDAMTGESDSGRVRVRFEYFMWSLLGPVAWRRALSDLDADGRAALSRSRAAAPSDSFVELAARRGSSARAQLALLQRLRMRRTWWRLAVGALPRRAPAAPAPVSAGAQPAPSPDGWEVIVGPGEHVPDLPVPVVQARGERSPVGWWEAVTTAAAASTAEKLAIVFPGVQVGPRWFAEVSAAFEGERLAGIIGAGLKDADPPQPVRLVSRRQSPAGFPSRGVAAQFLAVRRSHYEDLGGFDPSVAALAAYAPLLHFTERAFEAGFAMARCDTHDISPPGRYRPARARGEWARMRARGALIALQARELGWAAGAWHLLTRGALPLVRLRRLSVPQREGLRHSFGALAAFSFGAAWALASGLRPAANADVCGRCVALPRWRRVSTRGSLRARMRRTKAPPGSLRRAVTRRRPTRNRAVARPGADRPRMTIRPRTSR